MNRVLLTLLSLLVFASTVTAQPQTNVATLPVNYGGALVFRNVNVLATDLDVSTTPATLYGWHLYNGAGAARFFKFYNSTAANTTVGTTTPFLTIPIPAGAAANVYFPQGIRFSTAMSAVCVTGVADNSTGAPGANECVANVFYKN